MRTAFRILYWVLAAYCVVVIATCMLGDATLTNIRIMVFHGICLLMVVQDPVK